MGFGEFMDALTTGRFICKLRKENNMTQAALAEKLNISNRTVSKWENGDGFPDITIFPELAQTLGVTTDELLKGERIENAVKVTEVESKDNLDNFFRISYVISLFIGAFSALLGGITEIYCIWAFRILFYTHWEIMFVAVALFSTILSGLIFCVGVTRLGVSYKKDEIISMVKKKLWLLSLILSVFPAAFLLRLVDAFLVFINVWILAIAFVIVLAVVFYAFYKSVK